MPDAIEFAVTDVETTGFCAHGNDRIVEIAIVRIDGTGRTTGEYTTLVNPERDVGPTRIHGITASDVREAPIFAEVAGDVLGLLRGAVFVSHNVPFDKRFIMAEFQRLGFDLPDWPHLCTLDLARRSALPVHSRRLDCLCEFFGIPIGLHHAALHDARAVARLLLSLLPQGEGGVASQDVRRAFVAWPALPCGGRRLDRSAAKGIQERKPSLLETVVRKLPTVPDLATNVESYLAALDRVLEDRLITADEESRLVSIAQEYGLTASEIVKTHHCYLLELLRVALRDGILTKLEREDLEYVRRVLGISDVDAIALLGKARQTPIDPTISGAARPIDKRPITGKTICFTGELRHGVDGNPVTREQAEAVAKSIGMVVRKSVTKKLDYLVVADAATSSAKARKARGYGCRIIAEPVFWQMVASRPS